MGQRHTYPARDLMPGRRLKRLSRPRASQLQRVLAAALRHGVEDEETQPSAQLAAELAKPCELPTVVIGFASSTAALAGRNRSWRTLGGLEVRPQDAFEDRPAVAGAWKIDLLLCHHPHRARDTVHGCTRVVSNPRFTEVDELQRRSEEVRSSRVVLAFGCKPAREAPQTAPGFRPQLVIDLLDGLKPALRSDCDAGLRGLVPLRSEMEQIIEVASNPQPVLRRCAAEAFDQRLQSFRLCERLLFDRLTPAVEGLSRARPGYVLTPGSELPAPAPHDGPGDLGRALKPLLAVCDQTLTWAEALPAATLRDLGAWREAAARAVRVAAGLGVHLKVGRPTTQALRSLESHHLDFLIGNVDAFSDSEALRDRLDALLDNTLNPAQTTRPWMFDVWLHHHGGDYVEVEQMFCRDCGGPHGPACDCQSCLSGR